MTCLHNIYSLVACIRRVIVQIDTTYIYSLVACIRRVLVQSLLFVFFLTHHYLYADDILAILGRTSWLDGYSLSCLVALAEFDLSAGRSVSPMPCQKRDRKSKFLEKLNGEYSITFLELGEQYISIFIATKL